MSEITPFKIDIADEELIDLKQRLALTRFPDKEPLADWSQGIPLEYMKQIKDYWQDQYDWRARETLLNRWEGFVTELDGVSIHFLHIRSSQELAKPLLLTHGWPGSLVEFQKVIGPLTEPQDHGGDASDAFHLVVPSLPGFGFSGKPTTTGWGVPKIAEEWNNLMLRLGYDKYFAQGGDWGAIVTTQMGVQNLGNLVAMHVNMPIVGPDPETMDDLSDLEKQSLAALQFYQEHDSGYSKQQSTRPQTLGYGLADSPIGQAGWILEKFYQWMDCDGHPENVVSRDELLDNVMFYWLGNAGASSARIYWESMGNLARESVEVPTSISIFPKEIFKTSERWARKRFLDLRTFSVLDKGGHFAAFEQPETFVNEIRTAFRDLR